MGHNRHFTRASSSLGLGEAKLGLCLGILVLAFCVLLPSAAKAAVVCPNPVPVVNENQCKTGTSSWQINQPSPDLGGYTTQTSVDLGENVTLKIGRDAPVGSAKTVDIGVYRMGYYGGEGGRLVNSASKVAINNDYTCKDMDETTGEVDCGNWSPTYTIPASSLPASGVYIVKLTASSGEQTQVVFTVRDDDRAPASKVLFVLPISSYEAYNVFGGKSLYYGVEGGNTVSGTSRAVKVSFNRPFDRAGGEHDWFFGPDYNLLMWMERQGYDISYTDDVHLHEDPGSLLEHDTLVVSGHAEYWSLQQFNGFKSARAAGVNIASFSANTAYWKVRYEDGQRTLVCYKTVEGSGSAGSGAVGQNDWGPDGIKGTADDALGLDQKAGTADDNPQNATTTFRDNGAPNGDPAAPPGGRVGPDMPENELFGIMYQGDNDGRSFPITVPPGNANEEFAADRVWRNTGISENGTTDIGTLYVNWEWDAIPTQAQYLAHQPANVRRIYSTNVQTAADNSWIQDEGRLRNTTPPPGQPGTIGAVRYTAASGARVFAGGTMQWSRALSNETDERIQQATYNVFSDMGLQPNTPEDVTLDPGGSNQAPNGSFTISLNPAKTATAIGFNGSTSSDPDGTIAKYEWDLDGDGSFETNAGTKSSVTHSYAAEGTYNVRLRVTDNGGATDLAVRTLTIIDNQPPTASFTATPNVSKKGDPIAFTGAGSSDPDGTIAKYEWDFDGNGSYETNGGSSPALNHTYSTPGTYTVGLRVTDNGGKTATTTRPVSINSGEVSKYSDSVLATPGLSHYWRMGETTGPTFADSKGSSPATAIGNTVFGVPGGVAEDPDRAAEFNGVDSAASAAVNLSGTHTVTVEFWMKWDNYANDDRLAMELTGNFNNLPGGFLVDPNAPQLGGTFGVGVGSGPSRNNVFFDRPSAGAWHHYAFVLNTAAAASQQIVPYVDGKAVTYTKLDSGIGSGNFANSTLYMMSRGGADLRGAGDLDEVALYTRALSASTIGKHYAGVVVEGEEGSEGGGEEPPHEEEGGEGGEEEGPGPGGSGASYSDAVIGTQGLLNYWSMGDAAGPTILDSAGSSPATASAGSSFGAAGGVPGETGSSIKFDGVDDAASANLHLAGRSAITVEFWMKWNGYSNDDDLAMEYTPNFNSNAGGFLIDPNSSYGSFAVALGIGPSRNVALFARPSTGTWHHYAFVLDAAAPASQQIVPYVDGLPVAYSKAENGSGAGAFADSSLHFMSRAGSSLFGAGNLQDVAVFDRALGAATISGHYASNGASGRPVASLKGPATAKVGETVQFDASGSKDSDGSVVKYEWDLDGNGSFETDTGTTPSASRSYASAGAVSVRLRVTDDAGNTGTAARTLTVEGGGGGPAADYKQAVLGTAGLVDYWRLDESAGSVFADSAGTSPASTLGAPTLNVPGGVPGDANTAARFDGVDDSAGAALQLAGKAAITVEFWMKWNGYANDDDLAMEYTPNYNDNPGGFLVDPNSSYGSFAVGLGQGSSRNLALFARPSAGAWHHYAFVLDTTAPASEQVVPYVDGKPVAYTKAESGTGAPAFANATLTLMSRAGSGLFGAGDLDDVSIYDRPLAAGTIADHYAGLAANQRPSAAFSAPASVKVGQKAEFDASASSDPDGSVSRYEWDLDGNGSFETSTGSSPSASRSYASAGAVAVGLRVTDDAGATGIASRTVTVEAGGGGEEEGGGETPSTAYRDAVLASSGLLDYWRLGEKSGSILADSAGAATLSTLGEPTLGVPGAVAADSDTAVRFDGVDDAATVPLTLGGRTAITVEFWMKWAGWANDDDLAMEYTPNFNDNPGGFLIDPNSGYGRFAVGIGQGSSRNVALFARPTAGTWHHYAFVLDTTAPATEQIVPYVDGKAVEYTKAENGSGAPAFADAALSLMSRAGSGLFGAGDLDDVALYGAPLSAATITGHYDLGAPNTAPSAAFAINPNPASTKATVNFNAAGSADGDGSIVRYEWDLDGNGSYETDGGGATTSLAYTSAGERTIGLRVTDNRGATDTAASVLTVQNQAPTASFTATPNPIPTGSPIALDAAASSDPDGSIAKYEWDLDGNGSYETSTGTTAAASTSFATQGSRAVGLRVTDDSGATATTTRTVTVQNRAPSAAFAATPNPAVSGQAVAYNGSASSDPDGTIAKYEWDLDGDGSYETATGATATASRTYATPGDRSVSLRVTDNNGATATTTKTVSVQNRVPTAAFTATPSTALSGTAIAFNAGASSDPDGTIAKYEWDLDGNGSYETDGGTSATRSFAYATPGTRTVGLRVTDNSGGSATATQTVTIQNRAPSATFTATPNPAERGNVVSFSAAASGDPDGTIALYEWDLDGNGTYETNTGATATATSTYATTGARTIRLRTTDNSGATATATQSLSVVNHLPEPSFTVTPNPVLSGSNAVLNAAASKDPDGSIAKYEWDLDGNGTYEVNAGSTSSTTRSFPTAGERTVGLRVTDNNGTTATTTRVVTVTNRAPTASFTASPSSVTSGTSTTLNAGASSDPDGTIAKYEWDLDGNGTYETPSASASTTTSFATQGTKTVGLRVSDNLGATATTTRTVTVTNRTPTASFTTSPTPALAGTNIAFDAGASSDLDGTIAKYEWDLDGNGTYEVNAGTAPTTTKSFTPAGDRTIRLRVTDNNGATAVDTETLSVRGAYNNAVLSTAGLIDYWRLGESSGSTLANGVTGAPSASRDGATLGVAGNLTADTNTALSFDGSNDDASASLNLSGTQVLTLEFWLKWNSFSNNDDLAFEFTSNFNNANGGFLINPNSSSSSGRFEVALGRGASRNNAYFTRPSANVWHHYAVVLNTAAPAAQQIVVYVDGAPVSIVKGSSGTGAGAFANSTLNFMSRNGSFILGGSLYGAGTLDEVAIYNQALSAIQVSQHFAAR